MSWGKYQILLKSRVNKSMKKKRIEMEEGLRDQKKEWAERERESDSAADERCGMIRGRDIELGELDGKGKGKS